MVAVTGALGPAVRAARTSTVQALSDPAHLLRHRPHLNAVTAYLPTSFLLGIRLLARAFALALSRLAVLRIAGVRLALTLTGRAVAGVIGLLLLRVARRSATLGLRGLAHELLGHGIELGLRHLQRGGVVAEDAFRGAFDAVLQIIDAGPRALLSLAGLRQIALAEHFASEVERLGALLP